MLWGIPHEKDSVASELLDLVAVNQRATADADDVELPVGDQAGKLPL
jgi:hypothetical protein